MVKPTLGEPMSHFAIYIDFVSAFILLAVQELSSFVIRSEKPYHFYANFGAPP